MNSQHPEVEAATGSKASRPRRGRPSGAKRIPLTLEERRARNAQYERERRKDFAAAQAELAGAAGCDPNVIASCFEQLGPNFILSDGEDDEPHSRKRKLSEETFGDDKCWRPGEKRMPADLASTADLADAGPSSSPNTLQTTTDGELSLVYITPPSPLLSQPSPSESTPLRLEAVSEEDISLPSLTPPSGSPPLQLESKDVAELFSQDELRKIYGALNSVDQIG
ncbi:hypothetical protein HW555_010674 [Spodoptera exigua]|uniref:Uncharacterized protein n=1 Tax=Spodoptera exigua TaxID=7107 RepID=A0A835KZJ9_SPOEX|nr:hypothetical protein HW555_010674 [Spodoptera exigua]